ncbi:MAG: filamentous hemagglutinin N-terminal domain-containing protein [Gammaproteobacteria bacterium]|nr:filamentous hemagglutinin N-terminal domain-containing protein [Gammaproteobacteria bacterium]
MNFFKICIFIWFIGMLPVLHAEIVLDGSLGPENVLRGPDFIIEADFGQHKEKNLFHSFAEFNLDSGQSATFHGSDGIERVFSRVTGGNPSHIDGLLRLEIPRADLYFLNPAGVVFGENASLDLPGSLYVSTADYIRLGESGRFAAIRPQESVLAIAPPSAFGFFDGQAGAIEVKGNLYLKPGRTLGVTGGDIDIRDGALFSSGGEISAVSIASAGEAPLKPFPLEAFKKYGTIKISVTKENNSLQTGSIDTTGPGGGKIFIRAGRLMMENSYVFADTYGPENGRGIDVQVKGDIVLKNVSRITADVFSEGATGNGGNIEISADRISLEEGSQITSNSFISADGNAGDITVFAREKLSISGCNTPCSEKSAILSATYSNGNGGEIELATDELFMDAGGEIRAETRLGSGDAGNVSIQTGRLYLHNGAQINVGAGHEKEIRGTGDTGMLTVRAEESIVISGQEQILINGEKIMRPSALLSNSLGRGNGGNIEIAAPVVTIQNNGKIQAVTRGSGKAGNIVLKAEQLYLTDGGFLATFAAGSGEGGAIQTDAREVNMESGGHMSSQSLGEGDAGNIMLTAGTLKMRKSDISTQAQQAGGGNIIIEAENCIRVAESEILANAKGADADDKGGNLTLHGPVFFILRDSNLLASAVAGNGGDIRINAQHFIQNYNNVLDASSALGIDGTVVIKSPALDLGDVLILKSDLQDKKELLTARCASRSSQASSFIRKPLTALPAPPNDMNTFYVNVEN